MLSIDSPRERLMEYGAAALSDTELLAIVLRSGGRNNSVMTLARKVLLEFGGLKGLANANYQQLKNVKDIGQTKAVTIKAMSELAIRLFVNETANPTKINTPKDAYNILRKEFYLKNREHLYLLALDSRKNFIAKDLISIGTINETLVHPREVFRCALLRNAVSIILAHNHPSGDSSPSNEDILLTERIAEAGITIGIALLDHIIVCDNSYTSLKAQNLFDEIKLKEGR